MTRDRWFRRAQILGIAAFVVALVTALARDVLVSPDAPFLSRRDAPWIVAPTPLQTDGIAIDLASPPTAFFARPFAAEPADRPVVLHVRALREVDLLLNDRPLPLAPGEPSDWKRGRTVDLAPHLVRGENVLFARVRNRAGSPALQIWIEGLGERVQTDASWIAAWEGDPPARAEPAEESVRHPEAGLFPAPSAALAEHAGALAAVAAFGAALFVVLRRLPPPAARAAPAAALGLAALVYALVFRNVLAFPAEAGFDAAAHLQFIDWIATHRALPHPREGSAMYHPPLYHAATALLVRLLHPAGASVHAIALLLPIASGLGMAWIAGATVRALAPGAHWLAAAAILVAAFLPMNLTIAASVSNEAPAAFLIALALLVATHALLADRAGDRSDVLLGAALGAAAATKYSALIWIAILLGAVAAKRLLVEGTGALRAARGTAIAAGIVAATAGWAYARNAMIAGDPLVWSLNANPAQTWFQLPGFHTADYFTRFGESLALPWFASFRSFWDSLYSTLWGDGLLSGASRPGVAVRRWNYDAMAAGFGLAVPATLFVAGGWVRAVVEAARGPDLGRRLALSLLATLPPLQVAAIASLTLRYPFWSVPKAFYALALTPSLAALGVFGFAALDALLARRAPLAVRALPYGFAAAFLATAARSYLG